LSYCLISYREVLERVRTFADNVRFEMASAKVTQNKNDNDTKRLPKYYSFDFIKENIKEKSIKSLDRDILSKFCAKLQLKTSGTKETLIARLAPLQDDTLFDKRVHLIDRQFKFATSLPRESVPPPTACWKFEASLFPKIGQSEIHEYQSQKRQGRQGQYRKAYRMFQSRRMKHIKVLQGEGATKYIKASVLKSFSTDVTRTVTVVFEENKPRKAFCECPVGACGLCCHAILVLLQLKHFTEHKQFLLALTCTQKLQKWHRPGVSDKVKAKAKIASHIRLKYFRNVRSARKDIFHKRSKKKIGQNSSSGTLNNIDKSDWYTRDVENIDSQVQDRLHRINVNISNHFMKCLKKYKIQSGLSQHLAYKNAYLCRIIQKEHDYAQRSVCYNEALLKPKHTGKAQDIWHGALTHTTPMNPRNNNNECFFSSAKAKDLLTLLNSQSNDEILSVKLPKCDEKINIIDGNNYVDVAQGSREWFASRIGIITASKLPALLGLNGNKEFDAAWFCINNKLDENVYRPKHFKNFERGKKFENAALSNFTKVSGETFDPLIILWCVLWRVELVN